MRSAVQGIICFCVFAALLGAAPPHDPDEGTLASGAPRIPEPMVYDLVRPLGAVKGELEVNSLFLRPLRGNRTLEWAPEIEYTFARGYGIELEFPMEGSRKESWKAAIQGTIGLSRRGRTIHGWQTLGERWSHEERNKVDLLYLTGTRWHERWSTFSMVGPRWERANQRRAAGLLWNQSVFYHKSKKLNIGLESNWAAPAAGSGYWLAVPQVTWRKSRYNIQFGAGSRLVEKRIRPVAAWRISREF
jgi:hypothetical protein